MVGEKTIQENHHHHLNLFTVVGHEDHDLDP